MTTGADATAPEHESESAATASPLRLCPRAGCPAVVRLASMGEAFSGDPIWHCEAGHSGPRMVGVDADG